MSFAIEPATRLSRKYANHAKLGG